MPSLAAGWIKNQKSKTDAHMFPYRDENETQRQPIVTGTIIGLNVLAWVLVQGAGAHWRSPGPSAISGSFPES